MPWRRVMLCTLQIKGLAGQRSLLLNGKATSCYACRLEPQMNGSCCVAADGWTVAGTISMMENDYQDMHLFIYLFSNVK